MLQVSGNAQHLEKFKYVEVVFTSDRRRKKEIDVRIVKSNAHLRELHCSVVRNRDL